jgi:hypothetical protein
MQQPDNAGCSWDFSWGMILTTVTENASYKHSWRRWMLNNFFWGIA